MFFGLLRRRWCWRPTARSWLAMGLAVLLAAIVLGRGLYAFLAPMDPLPDGALVVEGWADDIALRQAVALMRERRYGSLFVTGASIDSGRPLSSFGTLADLGAAVISQLSEGEIQAQAVPSPDARKDRTFTSAIALKAWMQAHGGISSRITLLSVGPHSRRSRLLYEKAFAGTAKIGVISAGVEDYDSSRWWASSNGFRSVLSEAIAYGYARFLFR